MRSRFAWARFGTASRRLRNVEVFVAERQVSEMMRCDLRIDLRFPSGLALSSTARMEGSVVSSTRLGS